jgi:hypothetical protein
LRSKGRAVGGYFDAVYCVVLASLKKKEKGPSVAQICHNGFIVAENPIKIE